MNYTIYHYFISKFVGIITVFIAGFRIIYDSSISISNIFTLSKYYYTIIKSKSQMIKSKSQIIKSKLKILKANSND